MSTVCIAAIIYLEPEWQKTAECIRRCGVDTFWADRAGIGSMAAAYNHCFESNQLVERFDYVWFLSNVTFANTVLGELRQEIERNDFVALHPSFESDHWHTRPAGVREIREVPFAEFTALLVSSEIFRAFPLDETMPYWGHDLDWGYRVRRAGHKIGVHHGVKISHSYIRHNRAQHPITTARAERRRQSDNETRRQLQQKYGDNWQKLVCLEQRDWVEKRGIPCQE